MRAAAGPGAAVYFGGDGDVAGVVAAARAAGAGVVFAGKGGWDPGACVARLAEAGVRLVLVEDGVGGGREAVGARDGAMVMAAAAVGAGGVVGEKGKVVVVEVQNGTRAEFVEDATSEKRKGELSRRMERDERGVVEKVVSFVKRIYLPAGYPHTVSEDYLSYTLYRITQNLASAIMTVLSTECLLYSVGLGSKVKATAAASAFVLKDGLGYFTKIVFGSTCGRMFDSDPKSWRIMADVVEDVGGAIEVIMPLIQFPGSFVLVASLTNVLKGAAAMTGTATRHVIYRQLTAGGAENIGDVATRGETQGTTAKAAGLLSGVAISKYLGQNYRALLIAYGCFAVVHLAANWRSMECVCFSFFNKQRLGIALQREFAGEGVPTPLEVSRSERIYLPPSPWGGYQAKLVSMGVRVRTAVYSGDQFREAQAMFKGEKFVITRSKRGKLQVLLRRDAKVEDNARAFYTVQKFLYDANVQSEAGGVARMSEVEYSDAMKKSVKSMKTGFRAFLSKCRASGWNTSQMLLDDSTIRADW